MPGKFESLCSSTSRRQVQDSKARWLWSNLEAVLAWQTVECPRACACRSCFSSWNQGDPPSDGGPAAGPQTSPQQPLLSVLMTPTPAALQLSFSFVWQHQGHGSGARILEPFWGSWGKTQLCVLAVQWRQRFALVGTRQHACMAQHPLGLLVPGLRHSFRRRHTDVVGQRSVARMGSLARRAASLP